MVSRRQHSFFEAQSLGERAWDFPPRALARHTHTCLNPAVKNGRCKQVLLLIPEVFWRALVQAEAIRNMEALGALAGKIRLMQGRHRRGHLGEGPTDGPADDPCHTSLGKLVLCCSICKSTRLPERARHRQKLAPRCLGRMSSVPHNQGSASAAWL